MTLKPEDLLVRSLIKSRAVWSGQLSRQRQDGKGRAAGCVHARNQGTVAGVIFGKKIKR